MADQKDLLSIMRPMGLSDADLERIKKEKQEKQEAERRRQIAQANQNLSAVEAVYQEKLESAKYAIEQIADAAKALLSLAEGVASATNNSHIGAPQCTTAIYSATGKIQSSLSVLESEAQMFSSGRITGSVGDMMIGGATSVSARGGFSPTGGGSSATMIHVLPEIGKISKAANDAAQAFRDMAKDIQPEALNMGSESADLTVFRTKAESMCNQLKTAALILSEYADRVDEIYLAYYAAQKAALERANLIPN